MRLTGPDIFIEGNCICWNHANHVFPDAIIAEQVRAEMNQQWYRGEEINIDEAVRCVSKG